MAIRVLPSHLVNKIAAGEVIERPASIVKELVENALDAGASRIDVAVADGGRKLISVSDDGAGMGPEDLELAFAPHATSKIAEDADLFAIHTMGFRGEALASIAAVSHAHIRSRPRNADSGHELRAAGGEVDAPKPCPSAAGTTVTIRDLFYNTPARRKFMRTPSTEFGHISEQITRLALPHPRVAVRLLHNGRETMALPAADSTAQRVADLFGPELADVLLPVRPRGGEVGVAGLVAPPSAARSSGKWQYFFLNGRYIRDRLLSHALREAYRGRIDPNKWPVAFLFIEVDPAAVDINVHPTKIEVRFRDGNRVHGELLASLKETLNRANLDPTAELSGPPPAGKPPEPNAGTDVGSYEPAGGSEPAHTPASPMAQESIESESGGLDEARRQSLRQALTDFLKSAPRQQRLGFSRPAPHSAAPASAAPMPAPPVAPAAQSRLPLGDISAADPGPSLAAVDARAMQVHNSYIVAATAEGLVVIDQHALHERILYNDLKRRLADPDAAGLASQRLLIPEVVGVTEAEAASLQDRSELLERLGIELQSFGPSSLAVQRFPSLLAERGVAATDFVRSMADLLGEDETADEERLLESVLAMMACKAAVKAGDPLSPEEVEDLLARRGQAEKASACPHGRPTALTLTLAELEKQFHRT